MISKYVFEIMEDIFERGVIDKFKENKAEYVSFECDIEEKIWTLTLKDPMSIPISPYLADVCRNIAGKNYKTLIQNSKYWPEIKERTGKLVFSPKIISNIFDRALTALFEDLEKAVNDHLVNIQEIYLTGGLPKSEIVVQKFKEKFPKFKIIIPKDPDLAVLKGAVWFGLKSRCIFKDIKPWVKEQKSPMTYGFNTMKEFKDGDPEEKKITVDGQNYCVDCFEKIITRDEFIELGKPIERTLYVVSSEKKEIVLLFFMSDEEKPQYVTEPSCKCIGKLTVHTPDLQREGKKDKTVKVSITFDAELITVQGVDSETKKKQEIKLSYLGKDYF